MSSVPNWKDATAYEFLKAKDPPWPWLAFEFLRRNPEYRAAYAAWRKMWDELKKRPSPWQLKLNDPLGWFFDPPLNEGESVSDWKQRVVAEGDFPNQERYLNHIERRFGITPEPLDPSGPAQILPCFMPMPDFPLFPDYGDLGQFFGPPDDERHSPTDLPKKPYFPVVFDLSRPLDPQLRAAADRLRMAKARDRDRDIYSIRNNPKRRNFRVPDLLLLLRVLDGASQGASTGEMASILDPDRPNNADHGYHATKHFNDLLHRAKKLRDEGYRELGVYRTPSDGL